MVDEKKGVKQNKKPLKAKLPWGEYSSADKQNHNGTNNLYLSNIEPLIGFTIRY